jgi:hypothetical protein
MILYNNMNIKENWYIRKEILNDNGVRTETGEMSIDLKCISMKTTEIQMTYYKNNNELNLERFFRNDSPKGEPTQKLKEILQYLYEQKIINLKTRFTLETISDPHRKLLQFYRSFSFITWKVEGPYWDKTVYMETTIRKFFNKIKYDYKNI